MTDHVIPPLVARRAALLGELTKTQERIQQLHDDLASLDAVIRQFDPDYPIGNIRPKYRRAASPAEFGSMSRAVLDTLRRAQEPMSAKEIAGSIIAERGLNAADRGLARSMAKRVDMALRYQRTNGMVEETKSGGSTVMWAIAG